MEKRIEMRASRYGPHPNHVDWVQYQRWIWSYSSEEVSRRGVEAFESEPKWVEILTARRCGGIGRIRRAFAGLGIV